MDLAVERRIAWAMLQGPAEPPPAPPEPPPKPKYCAWCQALLPLDHDRWCSHEHRQAFQARARGGTWPPASDDTIPEPLWQELDALAALPRAPDGALLRLELQYERPPKTLKVLLSRIRRGYRTAYRETST